MPFGASNATYPSVDRSRACNDLFEGWSGHSGGAVGKQAPPQLCVTQGTCIPTESVSHCSKAHEARRARKDRGEPVTDQSVAEKDRELDRALSTAASRPSRASSMRSSRASSGASRGAAEAAALVHTVFDLTGRTGSYVYMSPEVARCEPYNDRADVLPPQTLQTQSKHPDVLSPQTANSVH